MKKIVSLFAVFAFGAGLCAQQYAEGDAEGKKAVLPPPTDATLHNAPYLDSSLSLEERVEDLFKRLTDEEKAEIVHGASGYTYGKMPRIGLSEFVMSDGPQGVRLGGTRTATSYPCALAMAATWNPESVGIVGKAIAQECKATNTRIILAPVVNIMRTPLGGRTFELFGEDPVLSGVIASGYINGVQKEGIATSLKHWLLNDQEWARTCIDVDISERALREIYARPFEITIKLANPWTVMPSYNLVRGSYTTHNRELNDILYKDYKYDGALISDWGAWRNDIASINGGCTICMPSKKDPKRNDAIVQAVKEGKIKREYFDDAVRRNIRFALRVGAFNRYDEAQANTQDQQTAARKVAEDAMVLLKNDGILPLDPAKITKIAVIGPNADEFHTMIDGRKEHDGKGGAGATRPPYEITPLQGLVECFGKDKILYAPGPRFRKPKKVSYPDMTEHDPVTAAKAADLVIFCAGIDHTYDKERAGWGILDHADKPDIELPVEQAELIRKVTAANPKTIVVLVNGTPVSVEQWHDKVSAILEAWYGGQDAGRTIVDILTGKVNPSGKLPVTFGKKLTDWPSHFLGNLSYPGIVTGKSSAKQVYSDYIWVGYRGFDKFNTEPRYPFGFGLSYTTFKIEKGNGEFAAKVTNTGKAAGAEVVQCYISKPQVSDDEMPIRELIGFKKVFLKPGESANVDFTVDDEAMRYWSEKQKGWVVPCGEYQIAIGNSSRNLPVKAVKMVTK